MTPLPPGRDSAPGWHAFNLNKRQHHETLQRLAKLEPEIVGVGHGDPITRGADQALDELASKPVP